MRPFVRADRVAGEIQKVLSDLILRKIKDPRLKMVLITGVKLTADLKLARIYYTVTGQEPEVQACEAGLNSAAGFFKRSLSKELHLRYIPELQFFRDDSFEYGDRIDRLLKSVQEEDERNN